MTLFLTLILGCGPPTVDDSGTHTADTADTETRPASDLRAAGIEVAGAFGYDPDQGAGVAYYFGDTSTPALKPWLELTVSLEADNQLPGPCRITLQIEADRTAEAAWSGGDVRFGMDWDWDVIGHDDTCPDLDPEIYPDSLVGLAKGFTFGIGVLPMTDDVLVEVEADIVATEGQVEWDTYWVDNVIGGAVSWDALGELWTGGWALGFAVDADMALVSRTPGTEGPAPPPHDPTLMVPLTRAEIEAADGLPRGVYAINSLIEFDADGLLP